MAITLSKPQMKFLRDPNPLSIALTGRGGGKSFVGSVWTMQQAINYPNTMGFVAASNTTQLNTVAVKQLTSLLDECGIEWVRGEEPKWYNSKFTNHTNVLSICNGAQILLRSFYETGGAADRNIRGLNLGYAWLDESRELTSEVFDVILACLRDPKGPCHMRLTSTPNGKDWQWRRFLSEDKLAGTSCHRWTTHENKHLSPNFAASLKERLDTDTYNQEVLGSIVDFGANQVFRFNRDKNCKPCVFDPKFNLYYSTDLNVQNMSGVICQYDHINKVVYVLDEIYIRNNGSTNKACEEVLLRYSEHIKQVPEFLFMADEAGQARSTRVSYNDVDIMQQAFKGYYNARTLNGPSKPHVVESVTALNGMLDPADKQPRLFIDPRCKQLIKDLESVRWEEGEPRKIDKSDSELTHMSDSLRYICWNISQGSQEVRVFNLKEIPTIQPNDHNRSRESILGGNYVR